VVKAEVSRPRGPRFKSPLWRPFFRHHSFGSKLRTNIEENSNLACAVIPQMGGWTLRNGQLLKSQLHG